MSGGAPDHSGAAAAAPVEPAADAPVPVVADAPARSLPPPHDRWTESLVRAGYVARGAVYLAMGASGLAVAVGLAESARDARGAIRLIGRLPFGDVLVASLAVGLAGYAMLSFVAAVHDPERNGRGPLGILLRVADALAGAFYVVLAAGAIRLLADPGGGGARVAEEWAAHALAMPAGAWLLGIAGAALTASGVFLAFKSSFARFGEKLDHPTLDAGMRRALVAAARVGTAARGIILGLCGSWLMRAAVTRSPEHVGDFGDALDALGAMTLGPFLLAAASLGFLAYGAYQVGKARYRTVRLRSREALVASR